MLHFILCLKSRTKGEKPVDKAHQTEEVLSAKQIYKNMFLPFWARLKYSDIISMQQFQENVLY